MFVEEAPTLGFIYVDGAQELVKNKEGRYCLFFNKLILFRSEAMGYNI